MTREEAIRILKQAGRICRIEDSPAYTMAIAALRTQQDPVKLDRSRWDGCCCCKDGNLRMMYFVQSKKYCLGCGKPLTEEDWSELERRIT